MRAYNVRHKPEHTTKVKYKKRSILGSLFKTPQPFFLYTKATCRSGKNVKHGFSWERKRPRYLGQHFWFVPSKHKKRCIKILKNKYKNQEGN